MEVLIDANFAIACIRENLNFEILAEEIFDEEIKWFVPKEVEREIKKISKGNSKDAMNASIALEVLKKINARKVSLNYKNPNVDEAISSFLQKNNMILATLDKALKKKFKGRVLTIIGKKKIGIV